MSGDETSARRQRRAVVVVVSVVAVLAVASAIAHSSATGPHLITARPQPSPVPAPRSLLPIRQARRLQASSGRLVDDARAQAAALVAAARQQAAQARTDAATACPCAGTLRDTAVKAAAAAGRCDPGCGPGSSCRPDGTCACPAGRGGPSCSLAVAAPGDSPASQLTIIAFASSGGACVNDVTSAVGAKLPHGLHQASVINSDLKAPPNGQALTDLLKRVTTRYAMVLAGDTVPDESMSAAGVVAAMESSGLLVAGGLVVEGDGRSTPSAPSCHMLRTTNFTLTHTPGYQAAWGGCLVCDRPSDSFVVDVGRLRAAKLDSFAPDLPDSRFTAADLFLRLSLEANNQHAAGSCPADIIFRRVPSCKVATSGDQRKKAMNAFMQAYQVSAAHMLDGTVLDFCCCGSKKGGGNVINDLCRQNGMSADLQEYTAALERNNIPYSLSGGSHLSAFKFRRILPWDYDLDVAVCVDTWSDVQRLIKVLNQLKSGSGFRWKFSRSGTAATVFTVGRKVDIDTYVTIINEDKATSIEAGGRKKVEAYDINAWQKGTGEKDQRYTMSWRGVAQATAEEYGRTGKRLVCPLADMMFNGRKTSMQRYNYNQQVVKYGTGAALFHVTRVMAGVTDMFEGKKYGSKSLNRHSHFCAPTRAGGPGCLDGWVWFQDWENWPTRSKTPPAKT